MSYVITYNICEVCIMSFYYFSCLYTISFGKEIFILKLIKDTITKVLISYITLILQFTQRAYTLYM